MSPERAAFLDEACAGDPALRKRVDALLLAHDSANQLLDHPAREHLSADLPGDLHLAKDHSEKEELEFLLPSDYPGSLGRLAHYEILQVVGRGGMGLVLRAFDEKLHRIVAIKVLAAFLASNGSARQRFFREARAAAAVTHDHVIAIHAVENEPLSGAVHRRDHLWKVDRCDAETCGDPIGLQIAEGLARPRSYLIHRDIKPANILWKTARRVKITDFGSRGPAMTPASPRAAIRRYAHGVPEQCRAKWSTSAPTSSALAVSSMHCARAIRRFAPRLRWPCLRVCEDTPRPILKRSTQLASWLNRFSACQDPVTLRLRGRGRVLLKAHLARCKLASPKDASGLAGGSIAAKGQQSATQ